MNFSISRKAVKVLCLITVLILMTALFAGCKKNDEPAPESTEPQLDLNLNLTPSESEAPETEPSVPETTAPVISEKSATVVSQLNIRSAPSTSGSSVIGTLYAGDKVTVERREEVTGIKWAYISEPTTGWICMDFVEMDIPDAVNNNTSTPAGQNPTTPTEGEGEDQSGTTVNIKGVVTANGGLMIRSTASTNGEVKGMYEKGQVVSILETKNGWGRTNKGWIKLDYVNTSGTTTNNNNNTTNNNNTNVTGNGNTTVILKGVVKVKELNIRSSANTNADRVGGYTYGDRVEILEKDGSWGRTKKGWIHLDYVYQDGTTGTKTATGTVDANGLRLRGGPGTGYDVVGSLASGQTVKILEQFTYGGTTWGCTKDGWVSMDYINTGNSNTNNNDDDDDDGRYATITGTNLNIRSGPGTDYASVGSLSKDEVVKILDTTTVDGVTWGKISQGWISMKYAQYD